MARYTITLVFNVGPGPTPQGADVLLDRLELPDNAVHRLSSCDGSTLTVVVDFRSSHPASVCRLVSDGVRAARAEGARAAWAGVPGAEVGEPLTARVRPLHPPQPVAGGTGRPREYVWRPETRG